MEAKEMRAEISMRLNDEPDAETEIKVSPGVRSIENKLRYGRVHRCLWKDGEELDYNKIDDHGCSISSQMLVENVNYVGEKTTVQRKLHGRLPTKVEKLRPVENLNSDECCLCGMDGTLICCDSCPTAYHSRCVGVSKAHLPEGDWYCPECVVKETSKGLEALSGLQGAEILGFDPHGRVYFFACGYLLVHVFQLYYHKSDSSFDGTTTHKYYNRNDTLRVLKILDSSDPLYDNIQNAIVQCWDMPIRYGDAPKHNMGTMDPSWLTKVDNSFDKCSSKLSAISVSQSFVQQDQKKGCTQEDVSLKKVPSRKLEALQCHDAVGKKEDYEMLVMDQSNDNTQLASSEGSLEITSLNDVKGHQKGSGAHCSLGFTKSN